MSYGIRIVSSYSNIICRNNFIDNNPSESGHQAYDNTGNNMWDYGGVGNYWSDLGDNDGGPGEYWIDIDGNDRYPRGPEDEQFEQE